MDSLVQTLEQLVPQSLDDIIRLNRDKAQLYLSTNDELDVLRGPVVLEMPKARISHWAFITMHLLEETASRSQPSPHGCSSPHSVRK